MTQLTKLKLALIFLGGVALYLGYNEYRVSNGATLEPQPVDLAQLESGEIPDNAHLELGPHWRMYPELVFRYKTKRGGGDGFDDATRVEYSYYPVLSNAHPFFSELGNLASQRGGIEKISDDEFPSVERFAMLVKTKQFETVGAVPTEWAEGGPVQGLVINKIYRLKKDEAALLQQSFPGIDLASVLILEEGRQPSSPSKAYGMMGGGVGVSLAGLGWLLLGFRRRDDASPPPPAADVGTDGGNPPGMAPPLGPS